MCIKNILYNKPAAKPAFGGVLGGSRRLRRSNRLSTSFHEPEFNSCERLSLLTVPECGGEPGGGAYAHHQTAYYSIIVLDI